MSTGTVDLVLDPRPRFHETRTLPPAAQTEGPLYRNDELSFWALARHADVHNGFPQQHRALSEQAPGCPGPDLADTRRFYRTMSFLAMDDLAHLRLRWCRRASRRGASANSNRGSLN